MASATNIAEKVSGLLSKIITPLMLMATLMSLLLAGALLAQTAPMQQSPVDVAITGAKVYTVAGPPMDGATVLLRDGKIAAVGASVQIPKGAQVIDAKGLEVYPGLFDPVTQIGLQEIEAIRGTVDVSDLGDFRPELQAAMAVNPASAHIAVTRVAGITHVLSVPGVGGFFGGMGGNIIGGQAVAMNLAGWTMADMQIQDSVAMTLIWPSIETRSFDFSTFQVKEKSFKDAQKEYQKKVDALSDYVDQARHYAEAKEHGSPANYSRDLALEAMIPVVEGRVPVLLVANDKRDIRNGVNFCVERKLKVILAGGAEAWKEKDLLKKDGIPVILGPTLSVPSQEDDPYDKPMTQPAELVAAGIPIAFASFDTAFSRRLAQQAGTAVGYGLSHDEALRAVTVNAAKMLGLDGEVGTIEAGKMGNLIVTDGDPLEIRTQVKYLFIKGQLTSTDNRQKRLYEEYSHRPAAASAPTGTGATGANGTGASAAEHVR
jgi:imidazolonepropionase-like amidohydrolase